MIMDAKFRAVCPSQCVKNGVTICVKHVKQILLVYDSVSLTESRFIITHYICRQLLGGICRLE
jgi:hypothetical protein